MPARSLWRIARVKETQDRRASHRALLRSSPSSRQPSAEELQTLPRPLARRSKRYSSDAKLAAPKPPLEVRRDAVEENTGEKFSFNEKLHAYADFVPDLQPADVPTRTRALADVCLALFNSNEFAYVY